MNSLGINKNPSQTRVVVAMSGGVDSSVVAAMLHDEGYEVIGITLQLYDLGAVLEKKGACCAGIDIYDARNVADRLGIPHYVLDYESMFKQKVIDDFADTYLQGETPIPCIQCNQQVKFKDLLHTAKELGADALATGHYVQRVMHNGIPQMHKGLDDKRDQSYFLFGTTKEQLDFLRFPLGGMDKQQTRQLAEKYGLEVANKPDSQDICFVPNGDYASLISKLRPHSLDAGEIVHIKSGAILGQHDGIINYTIGQRKGLGISAAEPLYVVKINADEKRVYVGAKEDLARREFYLRDINWLDSPFNGGREVLVKMRSTQKPVPAMIHEHDKGARVELFAGDYAISPGQACVAYDGSQLLGGGWIMRG
jgi:tRNA-specific 2-thiouridylase